MSKAFTQEDTDDPPLVVPPRAPLPEGTPDYVTDRGLARLTEELSRLERTKSRAESIEDDAERRRELAGLNARAAELSERIGSAVLVDRASIARDEVRFGATVRVRGEDDGERTYRIVGVDEADAAHGLIAFVAPLARALLGKREGDVVTVRTPRCSEELEVIGIDYDVS
jgi:transcription elongation factor GreB